MREILIIFIITAIVSSCISELPTEIVPDLANDTLLTYLTPSQKSTMNGVYEVREGKEILGEKVVGKWIKDHWCMSSTDDVVFSENVGGIMNDTIRLNGYVRIVRSGNAYKVSMKVSPNDGGINIVTGKADTGIIIRGITDESNRFLLKKIKNLSESSFYVIAHRGGGRNSERLARSENSIEMIKYAEYLGANGVEIDIKRTRDGVPILFHDDTFSPRTVQGAYILGYVDNYDFQHLKTFGRLIYGEKIPALREALDTIIFSTNHRLVWLDIKDVKVFDSVFSVVYDEMIIAKRFRSPENSLRILVGVADEASIQNGYRNNKSKLKDSVNLLIEGPVANLNGYSNYAVWGPRWTSDFNKSDIQKVRDAGKDVFIWTVDYKDYIDRVLDINPSGIVSDYPSMIRAIIHAK